MESKDDSFRFGFIFPKEGLVKTAEVGLTGGKSARSEMAQSDEERIYKELNFSLPNIFSSLSFLSLYSL